MVLYYRLLERAPNLSSERVLYAGFQGQKLIQRRHRMFSYSVVASTFKYCGLDSVGHERYDY